MKTAIIVSTAFWTAVAVWGFWGWFAAMCAGAVAVYVIDRKQERN